MNGSSMKLGLDNYVRKAIQHSVLANLKGIPGNSIEWVRDDHRNLDKLSAPGYYIIRMVTDHSFIVSLFLRVDEEELNLEFIEGKQGAFLKHQNLNPDSESVRYEDGIKIKKDIEYTIDYTTGKILFEEVDDDLGSILIDYQVIGEESEEYEIEQYTAVSYAIPGVIIAFGDRLRAGDEQVVVVYSRSTDVADVYGGRWILNCDLIVVSQDDDQQERILDHAISVLWADWQHKLTDEGIHIKEFSLTGESEDYEAEIPEEYHYMAGISFTVEVDWELHNPTLIEIRDINLNYGDSSFKNRLTNLNETQYEGNQYDHRMINSDHQKGLQIVGSRNITVFPCPPITVRTLRYPH